MADSPNRSIRARRGRGISATRNSSARSSTFFDDHLHPAAHLGPSSSSHSLRPAESRFSLHEQFASTRREYEFGDDDASSVFERLTIASEGADWLEDKTITIDTAAGDLVLDEDFIDEDYYHLLCIPRDPSVTPEQIRSSYHRLLLILHKDGHPDNLHDVARPYFQRVQRGFETLIEPNRRAEYDLRRSDEAPELGSFDDEQEYNDSYDSSLREHLGQRSQTEVFTSSDLGIRFDATRAMQPSMGIRRRRRYRAVRPLDFTLSHSVTVGVPALGRFLERRGRRIRRFVAPKEGPESVSGREQSDEPSFHLSVPLVTISGSVYGLVEEMFQIPISLLSDRYQPLLPLTIPRHRVIQLAEHRLSPLITLKVRQDIIHKTADNRLAKTTIELERDVLPEASLTARVSHPIYLPHDEDPIFVDASLRTGHAWARARPRLGVGVRRRIGSGTAFALVDSGDWTIWPGDTCKFYSEFSRMNRKFSLAEFPLKVAPSFEIGYKTSVAERAPFASYDDSPRGESGIRGLDHEMAYGHDGSWTVSAAVTPGSLASYLRYGRDLAFPGAPDAPSLLRSGARVEVELCSNTLLDRYLAVRNLWSVGKHSKLGLEVGVSAYNFHLSLYWSRLSQRLSIPFLVSPRAYLSSEIVFWTGVVPFLAMAGLQFLSARSAAPNRSRFTDLSRDELHAYVAKKRAVADELAVLLSGPVEARQKFERQKGGLVILSAKFGVKDAASSHGWGAEEVADVTIAVAALVDDGKLVIPRGLRKGALFGFWDPVPGRKKALHVRYMYRGKEETVEVHGRAELVLPTGPRIDV